MQPQKRKGGQRKHWAEKARLWIWHREVKKRCDWTNHMLDVEFAWLNQEERAKKPDVRPRMFERIEKTAWAPKRSPDYRAIEQLVPAVDAHPLFEGTQGIYESRIWRLFSQESIDIQEIEAEIASIFDRCGLTQLHPPYPPGIAGLVTRESLKVVSDRCARLALEDLPDYVQIEVAWYLYVMARPAHSWGVREAMEVILDNLLDGFFYRHQPERHHAFYRKAGDAMVEVRFTSSGSRMAAEHKAEAFSNGLLVPKIYVDYLRDPTISTESVAACLRLF